jgi:hypothetical protein
VEAQPKKKAKAKKKVAKKKEEVVDKTMDDEYLQLADLMKKSKVSMTHKAVEFANKHGLVYKGFCVKSGKPIFTARDA